MMMIEYYKFVALFSAVLCSSQYMEWCRDCGSAQTFVRIYFDGSNFFQLFFCSYSLNSDKSKSEKNVDHHNNHILR